MPRAKKLTAGNRTDLAVPRPAVERAGRPNGKPVAADVPHGLAYGERGQLTSAIAAAPGIPQGPRPPRGRPMPPPPAGQDMGGGQGFESALQSVAGWTPPPVTPLGAPTERPDEHPMTGAIGRPDSVVPPGQTGGVGDLLAQVAQMTGSAALASLATRAQATGA